MVQIANKVVRKNKNGKTEKQHMAAVAPELKLKTECTGPLIIIWCADKNETHTPK